MRTAQVVAEGLGPVEAARAPSAPSTSSRPDCCAGGFGFGQVCSRASSMASTVVACSTATRSVSTAVPFGSCRTSAAIALPPSTATHRRRSPSRTGPAAFKARPQQAVAMLRVGFRVAGGTAGARPRPQVTEAVLDRRRVTRQVVNGLGDPVLALTRQRHLGQPVVDLHGAPQREVAGPQLLRLFPLPGVQARIGQGHPRLLGQDLQEKAFGLGGLRSGPDHQEASRAAGTGQGVGPRPRHVGQRDRPALGRVDDGRQAGGLPAGDPDVLPSAVEEDTLRRARDPRDRPRSRRSAGCCPRLSCWVSSIASTSMLRSAESCSRTGPS